MQPINMIMIYYWDQKSKRRVYVLEADIITIKKNIDLMFLTERINFFQDVFQMTTIKLVSAIYYHINELHLFWDTLYISSNSYETDYIYIYIYIYIYMK